MLCDICQKREAKIYYTEIIKGEKKEQHLCEECAAEHTTFFVMDSLKNQESFLGGLLAGLIENFAANTSAQTEKKEELSCKKCGMSLDVFFKMGHFGCSDCYRTFGKYLPRLYRNIHGGDTHSGKRLKGYIKPQEEQEKISVFTEKEKLQFKLQQAIEKEEFEEAAKLRDQIKLFQEEL